MERKRNAYRILVAKPKGKRSFGRPRYGWEDNIWISRNRTGMHGLDYSGSA
jgi:hypothetical protein